MGTKYNTLIMGASYGSLLAIKLVLASSAFLLLAVMLTPKTCQSFPKLISFL